MHGEAMEFIFMVINFVILFGALYIFGGKMVKARFSGRADKIRQDLDDSAQAAADSEDILSSVSKVDELAAEKREKLFTEAKELLAHESEESARQCVKEKEGILADAQDVGRRMSAGMHGRVYARAMDRLTDSVQELLRSDKFAQAREDLQKGFADDVAGLVKPARSDIVRMSEARPVDVLVSAGSKVDSACVDQLHDLVADRFLEYEYGTDPDLGTDIQVSFGDMVYRGTVDSILAQLQ